MKKKILALAMAAIMLIVAVVGGTLAYFTDSEQQTNEFAIGNVQIDLYEDVKQDDGADKVIIAETTLGKDTDENPGIKYENIQPGHVMTKIAHVENTGENDAYVALVIKQENYLNFNNNIDEYYEPMTLDDWQALGLTGTDVNAVMQEITDDVFPNWNLLYDKTTLDDPQIRYTIDTLPASTDPGVKVLGVGYAQENVNMSGVPQYHYRGAYFTNVVGGSAVPENEPNFFSISEDGAHDRVWIVYLMLAPGATFDMDLTTVCPTYFDNNSTNAFENMTLDIKAFAIQASGFKSDAEGQKKAFAEVLKAENVFAY